MAQLIKIQDYISRYQLDLKRYPTQFVRLKKQQWERMKDDWERGHFDSNWVDELEPMEETVKQSFFSKLFHRNKEDNKSSELEGNEGELQEEDVIPEESSTLHFQPNLVYNPKSIEELNRMYMDQLFHFQLKWASSTLREKSYVDPKYMRDTLLRMFAQRLPDNYFVLYYPILKLIKAPVELDIILILPTEIICIAALEDKDSDAFIGSSDRFWLKKSGKEEVKVLSPMIGLNRMESILLQIIKKEEIDLPIRKVVLSRNGYIDYPGSSFNVQFIDSRKFTEWFIALKSSTSPMKHMQFKAAQAILNLVQTTSYSRSGWEIESEEVDD